MIELFPAPAAENWKKEAYFAIKYSFKIMSFLYINLTLKHKQNTITRLNYKIYCIAIYLILKLDLRQI
jgi:hypothetical protein